MIPSNSLCRGAAANQCQFSSSSQQTHLSIPVCHPTAGPHAMTLEPLGQSRSIRAGSADLAADTVGGRLTRQRAMVLRTLLVGLAVVLMVGGAAAELPPEAAGTVMALNASQATAPNETCPSLVRWFGPAYAEFALMHWTRQPRPNCSSVWHRPPQWYVSCEPTL